MGQQFIETNGICLHVLQDGPEEGPLVILLHGFPEYSYCWKHQIPYLAAAGYRVWTPDQRGYNISDKPDGIASYSLDELAADVIGLIDAAGQEKIFLIGHDWGAAVAWWVAGKYPDRLLKIVIINVPHWAVIQKHLRSNFSQLLKSWYFFFFQLPQIPELLGRQCNWYLLTKMLKNSSRKNTFSKNDLDKYREAWSQPKAFSSMLNWYRSMIQKPPAPPSNPRITVPTLLIWGIKDNFLGKEMAQPSIDLCDDGRLILIEEATHWVQHEEAKRVNEAIYHFIRKEIKD